jgi:hypothetical protein
MRWGASGVYGAFFPAAKGMFFNGVPPAAAWFPNNNEPQRTVSFNDVEGMYML